MDLTDSPSDGPAVEVWRWMRSDPRNTIAVLTLPYVVFEVASEARWRRAHGMKMTSAEGFVAYVKARPLRFALSLVVSLAPEIVGLVNKARRESAG